MTRPWLTFRPITDRAETDAASELIVQDLPHCSLERYLDETSSMLGAFDQGELIACLHWRPAKALWLGRKITIGQTGPGATAQSYRSNGVMRTLLRSALLQMKEAGVVLAGQETPVIAYHRRTGWEVATLAHRYSAKASSLLTSEGPHLVGRPCNPDDIPGVMKIWESLIRDRPLTSARSPGRWSDLLISQRLICVGDAAGISGYAALEAPLGSSPVVVNEVGALTTAATKALLKFLATEIKDTGADIEWWTPADRVDLMVFPDPRAPDSSVEIDKLVRVVDAHSILSSLAKSSTRGPAFDFVVSDGVADWNSLALRVQPGSHAEVVPESGILPRIDVRAIAALCCGSASAGDLAAAGLVSAELAESFGLLEPATRRQSWYPEPL